MGILSRTLDWLGLTKSQSLGSVSNPSAFLLNALGGNATTTGLRVGPDTALRVAAVHACVQVISQDVKKLPIHVRQRRPDGGSEIARDHPLESVFQQPNAWQARNEWIGMLQVHKLLRGNGFAFVPRTGRGAVDTLVPLHSGRVTIYEAPGELFYGYAAMGPVERDAMIGEDFLIPSERVLHLRGMTLDGIAGVSPIAHARETIGLAMATEQHAAKLFQNGARVAGLLKHPSKLSDVAALRIKASWQQAHGGLDNAFKTALLEEGMDFTPLTMTPEEGQFLETRQYGVTDIARIFRVPPHKIADLTRSTNNNIEHQGLEYYTDTLMPHLEDLEAAADRTLLTPTERKRGLYIEVDFTRILRGDMKSMLEAIGLGRSWGVLSSNEARVMMGLNPRPGGDNDFLRPSNHQPWDAPVAPAAPLPPAATAAAKRLRARTQAPTE